MDGGARLQEALGDRRLVLRIDPPAQAELVDIVLQLHPRQQIDDAPLEAGQILDPRGAEIDPLRMDVEQRIAGALGFGDAALEMHQGAALVLRGGDRAMLQAIDHVLQDGVREEIGLVPDIGDVTPGDAFGQRRHVLFAPAQRAVGRGNQARQQQPQRLLAGAVEADDREMVGGADLQPRIVQQAAAAFLVVAERLDREAAFGRGRHVAVHRLQLRRQHAVRRELLDHLLVLDLHVLALLLPVDQLLDRARQVLVGVDHSDQRADVELALQREIAADQVEQERRGLREHVVEVFDEELALVELEADQEDLFQPVDDVRALVVRGVVGVDLDRAVDILGDAPGQLPRRQLPLPAELQDALPQQRDHHQLHRQHHHRDQAKPHVLYEDEGEGGQRLSAEERRRDIGIADEAAQRLHLVLDHGRDFRLLDLAEVRDGEAQHPVVELVAQAAQHALAEAALLGVDQLLDPAVHHHEEQEREAQGDQVGDLVELKPLEQGHLRQAEPVDRADRQVQKGRGGLPVRERLLMDGLVHDLLGQVEGDEIEHVGDRDDDQDDRLVAPRVSPDVAEKIVFHARRPRSAPHPARGPNACFHYVPRK